MGRSSDNVKRSSGSNPPEDPTTCATTPIALDWPTRARRPTVKSRTTTRKLSSTTSCSTTRSNYSWKKAASTQEDGDEAVKPRHRRPPYCISQGKCGKREPRMLRTKRTTCIRLMMILCMVCGDANPKEGACRRPEELSIYI